jgi:hypothetical protein
MQENSFKGGRGCLAPVAPLYFFLSSSALNIREFSIVLKPKMYILLTNRHRDSKELIGT